MDQHELAEFDDMDREIGELLGRITQLMLKQKGLRDELSELETRLEQSESLMDSRIKGWILRSRALNFTIDRLRKQLKEAYNLGRKYPHDKTGSSFDRWLKRLEDDNE